MIGQILGHYRILEKIGEGGMGVVYRAHDERLDRDVALKVLPAGTLADESARKRFRKEARALSKLNHPNIETVHDFDTQENVDFLVMEYIPGVTLSDKLAAGPLTEKEILRIGAQLAEGLTAAHAQGIIHRDLKPGNLRLTPDGRLKILDFGLAKLVNPVADAGPTASVTETRHVAGTLPYMAPEQLRGELVDARTDIYAAGNVLYELATGHRPFETKTLSTLTDDIFHKLPVPPQSLNAQITAELERIILKCLDKDPERRYQYARELHVDLERLGTLERVLVTPKSGSVQPLARKTRAKAIKSLAVLPLTNLSRDPEQEYFADGMTEALITDLAKVSALKVISRTSVMRYKGTQKTLPEIAQELNVDAVMEGSVLRVGDRVRITAQLIHAVTDTHVWAESYDRDLRDILTLQSEVARAIVQGIRVKTTPQESERLARTRRVNPEAHEFLLKARYHWAKMNPDGFRMSIEHFQRALEKDPTYAPAYAGLADSFSFMAYWGFIPPQEAYPKAKAAALRAIELDDTLAEAHRALSVVHWFYDWHIAASEKEVKRALELSPNDAIAHLFYAVHLAVLYEDHARASIEAKEAEELDPLSAFVGPVVGWTLFWARQFDLAIQKAREVLVLDPGNVQAYFVMGHSFMSKRMFDEAIAAYEKAVEYSGGAIAMSFAGEAYGLAGQKDKAQAILNQLQEKAKSEFVPLRAFIFVCSGLGDHDKTFEWIEKALQERDSVLYWIKVAPQYDPLRSDPRFDDLVRRMNLPH